jgi:hypothetical protein
LAFCDGPKGPSQNNGYGSFAAGDGVGEGYIESEWYDSCLTWIIVADEQFKTPHQHALSEDAMKHPK